ncbi:hypothetical protein NDU88_000620 [Pleurodeles waltl]|uniref:Uncharacterized protein n=1 Tax=Pleurodeles waltl TaxID=8319 RepID=A0AAV7MI71_PLEWA|nr:hypothetical protein NDU88_000620 [Pleurodeles waltl]
MAHEQPAAWCWRRGGVQPDARTRSPGPAQLDRRPAVEICGDRQDAEVGDEQWTEKRGAEERAGWQRPVFSLRPDLRGHGDGDEADGERDVAIGPCSAACFER